MFVDILLRARPRRISVRIVRRPHDLARIKASEVIDPDILTLEVRPHIALDILARHLRQLYVLEMAQTIIAMIEAIHEVWQPGDVVLGRNNFQFRETLKHATIYHVRKSNLDLMWKA